MNEQIFPEADGSTYSVEVAARDRGEAVEYTVDLLRWTVDEHGLARSQRLTLDEHASAMEAEEQQQAAEMILGGMGIGGFGTAAEKLKEKPFDPVGYDVLVMGEGDRVGLQVVALQVNWVSFAPIASGSRWEMEHLAGQLEAIEDDALMLDAAQQVGVAKGYLAPDATLFNDRAALGLDRPSMTLDEHLVPHDPDGKTIPHHIDEAGMAHWFHVAEDTSQLTYYRAHQDESGAILQEAHPIMPVDEGETPWVMPGLELYLEKGDMFMAQMLAHDVAQAYDVDFPHPLDFVAPEADPEYYFGYGVSPNNAPSLEAVKTWVDGTERHFDTLTLAEYDTYDEAMVDEYRLEQAMAQQEVEGAMNLAERMAVANGFLDPNRDDVRIFFSDDAPPDPFTTDRQREQPLIDFLEPLDGNVNYAVVLEKDALGVEKHWQEADGTPGIDSLTVEHFDQHDRAARAQAEADRENLLNTYDDIGLEGMMHQAELTALLNGTLDGGRMDTRLFTGGPPDGFETLAARMEGEINPYFNTSGEKIEQPAPFIPEYGIGAVGANGAAFIDVVKSWGEYQYERLTIPQPSWEEAQFQAERAFTLQQNGDLQGAMRQVESLAEEAGVLDPERDDPRLFKTGPPDPFVTNREIAIDAELDRYGVTWRESHEWENEPPQPMDVPYWRLDTLPVNDPEGQPLGLAIPRFCGVCCCLRWSQATRLMGA